MRTWADLEGTKAKSAYKPCPKCGGPRARHARECQKCSQYIKRGPDHYAWKGDAAADVKKRRRVSNPRIWGPCERCGVKGVDRHHRDGNPGNNTPENIQVLCRRCHMIVDGRLERLAANSEYASSKRSSAA